MGSQICKYFGSCFYPLEGTLTSTDNTGQFSVFTVGTPQYFSIQTASLWFGMIGHCKYCLCSLSTPSIWTQEHSRRQASHGSFPFSIFIHQGLFHFSSHQQTKEPFWNILVLTERKGKKIWQIITWRGTCLHIFPSQSLRCSDICAWGLKRIRARNKNPGRSAEQLFGYTHALTLCPPFLPSFRDADAERRWERKLHASWGLAIGAELQMQSVTCLVSTSGKRQGYDQIRPDEEAFKGWF